MNKSILLKRAISFILLLACMVAIFLMSAQKGDESTDTSNGVVYYVAKIFVKDFANMSLPEQQDIMNSMSGFIRTAGHFCEFAALGFLSLNALLTFELQFWKKALFSFLFSVFYAITDEIHQYFVPDRVCDIKDVLVDSLGAATGIAFLTVCFLTFARFRSRKNDTQDNTVG